MIVEKFKAASAGTENPYGVGRDVWELELAQAKPDPVVGIRIAMVKDEGDHAVYVAAVPPGKEVGAHFHGSGEETYFIISQGDAVMCAGTVEPDSKVETGFSSRWEEKKPVNSADYITIGQTEAHQLKNNDGANELVFLFRCPKSHLTPQNRTMVPRAVIIAP